MYNTARLTVEKKNKIKISVYVILKWDVEEIKFAINSILWDLLFKNSTKQLIHRIYFKNVVICLYFSSIHIRTTHNIYIYIFIIMCIIYYKYINEYIVHIHHVKLFNPGYSILVIYVLKTDLFKVSRIIIT